MGWFIIVLGLINFLVYLYGIDNCIEGVDLKNGLELIKRIIEKFNLNLKICVGFFLKDVLSFLGKVMEERGIIDFVFVDGLYIND